MIKSVQSIKNRKASISMTSDVKANEKKFPEEEGYLGNSGMHKDICGINLLWFVGKLLAYLAGFEGLLFDCKETVNIMSSPIVTFPQFSNMCVGI
jgi:hypothetical protein